MPKELNFEFSQPGVRRIGLFNQVGLTTLCIKEVRRFLKVWTQTVLAPTITTLLFMMIFVWALGGSGRGPIGVDLGSFLAPGLMAMAIIQNAFQNPSSSILIGKVQGNIVDVLMPPLSAGELTFGFAIGGVTRGMMVGTVLWLVFSAWPSVSVNITHGWAVFYFGFSASLMMSLPGPRWRQ